MNFAWRMVILAVLLALVYIRSPARGLWVVAGMFVTHVSIAWTDTEFWSQICNLSKSFFADKEYAESDSALSLNDFQYDERKFGRLAAQMFFPQAQALSKSALLYRSDPQECARALLDMRLRVVTKWTALTPIAEGEEEASMVM